MCCYDESWSDESCVLKLAESKNNNFSQSVSFRSHWAHSQIATQSCWLETTEWRNSTRRADTIQENMILLAACKWVNKRWWTLWQKSIFILWEALKESWGMLSCREERKQELARLLAPLSAWEARLKDLELHKVFQLTLTHSRFRSASSVRVVSGYFNLSNHRPSRLELRRWPLAWTWACLESLLSVVGHLSDLSSSHLILV